MPLQHPAGGWPPDAIHDTVSAIVRGFAYRRSVRSSILDRVLDWLRRVFDAMFRRVPALPHAREWTIGLTLLVVVLVVARIIYAAQLREDAARAAPRRARITGTDPWAEAQRAAAEGRHTDAAHALYRTLLTALSRGGPLRLHSSKTAGDYARELRLAGSPAYGAFRDFGRRYDRIIYGDGVCDAAGYESLLRAAQPLLERERAA